MEHIGQERMPTGCWWGGPEAKGRLVVPTLCWEYNIKTDVQEIWWEIVDVLTYQLRAHLAHIDCPILGEHRDKDKGELLLIF